MRWQIRLPHRNAGERLSAANIDRPTLDSTRRARGRVGGDRPKEPHDR